MEGEAISGDEIKRAKSTNDSSFTIKSWRVTLNEATDGFGHGI